MANITLVVSEGEKNLILQCLAKQPFEVVAQTIIKINKQVVLQTPAAAGQPAPAEEPDVAVPVAPAAPKAAKKKAKGKK